jgi:hypothetical protein
MTAKTKTILVNLIPETCPSCGTIFGLTEDHQSQLRQSCKVFYCPNGHGQHYAVSEADRLREELAAVQARERNALAFARSVQDQNEAERRAHAATKGKLTKTRRRLYNGVCPCCNRSFANLGRHMAGQHPDYAGGN